MKSASGEKEPGTADIGVEEVESKIHTCKRLAH
jgi:hypothetical protein